SMRAIIDVIRLQTGYAVAGDKAKLAMCSTMDLAVEEMPLVDFLDVTFRNQPTTYKMEGRTIYILERKRGLFSRSNKMNWLQDSIWSLQGTVRDPEGKPIAGATVRLRESSLTTTSDGTGWFTLKS